MSETDSLHTDESAELARALCKHAAVLHDQAEYTAARTLYERALTLQEKESGNDHPDTARCLPGLAQVQMILDEDAQTRLLLERALIIRERAWGARHPETVSCLRKLAAALGHLHEQGEEDALIASMALYPCLTSLEMASGQLDPANAGMPGAHLDPDQAAGNLHHLLARLEVKLAQPPLSAAEQADLETAKHRARKADEFYQQEDYDSAASRLEKAVDIQERVLGEFHLDHVSLLRKLAYTRERQEQHSAILPIVQRVADIHVEVLGEDHPSTAAALSELMSWHAVEGDSAATRPLQDRILQSMQHTLGPDDPMVRLARQTYEVLGSETGRE